MNYNKKLGKKIKNFIQKKLEKIGKIKLKKHGKKYQ